MDKKEQTVNEILIVEDDRTIAMGIEYALEREGFSTHACYDFGRKLLCLHVWQY